MNIIERKKPLVATAITTLLSATVVIAVISMVKKTSIANDEFKTVLDGLVNVGTITRVQEVAIHSALIAAKEAAITNDGIGT